MTMSNSRTADADASGCAVAAGSRIPSTSAQRIERRLGRFHPRGAAAVRALAARHPRLADLASSFPALLFALAVPRRALDPATAIRHVVGGAPLARAAAAAGVPMWLRALPPEYFQAPLPVLPDGDIFRRRIANHLPRSPKHAAAWIQAIGEAARWGEEPFVIWLAGELAKEGKANPKVPVQLLCLWAFFSLRRKSRAGGLVDVAWKASMGLRSATAAARAWKGEVQNWLALGDATVEEISLAPDEVDGIQFVPLRSLAELVEEGRRMRNCLKTYAGSVAANSSGLWSLRKDGESVATLSVLQPCVDRPIPRISELRAVGNAFASRVLWVAAQRWLARQEFETIEAPKEECPARAEPRIWRAFWRPYWLAKRRIPHWLPLSGDLDTFLAL